MDSLFEFDVFDTDNMAYLEEGFKDNLIGVVEFLGGKRVDKKQLTDPDYVNKLVKSIRNTPKAAFTTRKVLGIIANICLVVDAAWTGGLIGGAIGFAVSGGNKALNDIGNAFGVENVALKANVQVVKNVAIHIGWAALFNVIATKLLSASSEDKEVARLRDTVRKSIKKYNKKLAKLRSDVPPSEKKKIETTIKKLEATERRLDKELHESTILDDDDTLKVYVELSALADIEDDYDPTEYVFEEVSDEDDDIESDIEDTDDEIIDDEDVVEEAFTIDYFGL